MNPLITKEWQSKSREFESWRESERKPALLLVYWKSLSWYFLSNVPFRKTGQEELCLDVGCGSGLSLSKIVKHKHYYGLGLDPSISSLRILMSRAQEQDLAISVVKGVGEYLPLRSSCARLVTIGTALDHLIDPVKVMQEVHRVLTHNGMLLVLQRVAETRQKRKLPPGHLRELTIGDLRKLLGKFRIATIVTFYGAPLPSRAVPIASGLCRLLNRLIPYSPQAIVLAKKSNEISRTSEREKVPGCNSE